MRVKSVAPLTTKTKALKLYHCHVITTNQKVVKLLYFRSRPLASCPANITAARKSNVWTPTKPSRKRTQSEQQTVRSSALQKTTSTHVKNGGKLYCQGHSKLIAATAVFAADSLRKRVRHSNGSDELCGRNWRHVKKQKTCLKLNNYWILTSNYPKTTQISYLLSWASLQKLKWRNVTKLKKIILFYIINN